MPRFLLLPSLLLPLLALPLGAAEAISVRADIWAPYNAQPDSDHPGFAIEMAKEIFATHDIVLDYQIMPWARAVQACKNGDIDAIMGASGLEFEGIVVGAQPLAMGANALIGLADQTWTYTTIASLDKIKVAYPRGYNYTVEIDTYLRANAAKNVTEVGGDEPLTQAVALLERKRVDAYVEDTLVFFAALPETKKKMFKVVGQLTELPPIHLAFSPTKPHAKQWATWLDQGVLELKRNGRRAAILARYGIVEPEAAKP